jgi:L-rhamnono-1,4-lactonase
MAQYPATYMKLSGAFSELPPLSPGFESDIESVIDKLQPWTDAVFDAFGPERIMFGSDWPVCNIGGGGNLVSWSRWNRVVTSVLERRGLDEKHSKGIWGQVAVKAYGVTLRDTRL